MTILTSKCKHCQNIGRSALDKTGFDSFFCVHLGFLEGGSKGEVFLLFFSPCFMGYLGISHNNYPIFFFFYLTL